MMMTADNKHQAIATQGGHTPHDLSLIHISEPTRPY